jgi:serine/threonine protein phosphatase PrpC
MHLDSAAATHLGRRKNNEDAFCRVPSLGLFAVCDGMGGYEGGEVASALAVEALERFVAKARRDPEGTWPCKEDKKRTLLENVLKVAALEAHRAIAARREGALSQMGSTVVAMLFDGARLAIGHVGDSRLYRLRDGVLTRLTRDHSLYEELLERGGSPGERADFPYRNQITRALGIEDSHAADTACPELRAGDTFLLCSDGLSEPVAEPRLAELLARPRLQDACDALVREAYEAGGTDNITAVLARALE